MIKNNSGDSIIGVMIGIFMIAFIIMGISNLLINSKALINEYDNKKFVTILENNSNNIINKLDTSNLSVGTEFYVYKDSSLKEFVIFTGATNEEYKYIDYLGNKIDDIENFEGEIFSRVFNVERSDNISGNEQSLIKINIKKYIGE